MIFPNLHPIALVKYNDHVEVNYFYEAIVIFFGFRTIYQSKDEKSKGVRTLIYYLIGISIFAAGHYYFTCLLLNGAPIYTEILFNLWIFSFALGLGKLLEGFWNKKTKHRIKIQLILLPVFIGLAFGILNCRRARIDVKFTPATFQYKYTETLLKTDDGQMIRTWFIPSTAKTNKLAIVSHGIGANLGDVFPFAMKFVNQGYDVVTFDWRSHGRSTGHLITFGEDERYDLKAVLKFIHTKESYTQKVVFAASMGTGTYIKNWDLLKAQGFTKLILESPYSDLREALVHKIRILPVPETIKNAFANFTAGLCSPFISINAVFNSPLKNIQQLSDTKVLIIHGKRDTILPYKCAEDIYSNLSPDLATLKLFEKADHLESYRKYKSKYEALIAEFLNENSTENVTPKNDDDNKSLER